MSVSILVPMHVEAKVVSEPTPVPALTGAPFNEEGLLEPGVHLHWALPDALTRARFSDRAHGGHSLFPGVPDLWLVVRFNPVPSGGVVIGAVDEPTFSRGQGTGTGGTGSSLRGESADSSRPKRDWRAWVVDSRKQTAVSLTDWSMAAGDAPESIHTFAGVLPSAAGIDAPGWGVWNNAEQETLSPLVAAYYPTARGRLGFHDDLADLGSSAGPVSYAVVGWYTSPMHDPLNMSPDRKAQLKAWRFGWKSRRTFKQVPTVVASEAASDLERFVPRTTRSGNVPASRVAESQVLRIASNAEEERQLRHLEAMKRSVGDLTLSLAGDGPGAAIDSAALIDSAVPREMVCHGAVLDVALGATATSQIDFGPNDVTLYPTIKTAMAAVASLDDAKKVEMVEALLQNLDGQMAKTQGGVLDLPAALHSLTFQGTPGSSKHFAQLDIVPRTKELMKAPEVTISTAPGFPATTAGRHTSGYWPQIASRSAAAVSTGIMKESIKDELLRSPRTEKPFKPTSREVADWMKEVGAALKVAVAEAAAKGTPIDPNVIRVRDSRKDAQPVLLGQTTDGRGSDGAAYWIDVADPDAMRRLLVAVDGASIGLPDSEKLYEVPGPRWYRSWSPQVVIRNQGRSYRFGEDGRFERGGELRCRLGGETLASIDIGANKVVLVADIVSDTSSIAAHADVPPEARALVDEAALLDAGNAREMAHLGQPGTSGAALEEVEEDYRQACQALLLLRDPSLTPAHRSQIFAMVKGTPPSPVAFLSWRDPWDPIFIDVNYAHPFSSLETDWTLEGEGDKPPSVEFRPLSSAATQPSAGQVEVVDQRSFLSTTIVHTLESALVTKTGPDKWGNPTKVGSPPSGVDDQTFKKMAVISAPLTGLDETLVDRGRRERTGALRLNTVDIVDSFGARRRWSKLNPAAPEPAWTGGDDSLPWWTALPPRLSFWSRMQFRLRSAENAAQDATFKHSPLCGFLLPDLLEHSLEVYDATGRALGQIRSDPPQRGSQQATTLDVWFELHPWMASELGLGPGDDPLNAISNKRLRDLVAGIAAQGGVSVPAGAPNLAFYETGLTAMMRIIDTLRPAIDPNLKVKDRKVRLTGGPIAVLAVGVWLEATGQTAPKALKGEPQPLPQPPAVPTLTVRIGDQSRPDDGVLGCFLPDPQPAQSKFAPVDSEAAEEAVLNELPVFGISKAAATHPFVNGLESIFPLTLGESLDLTVLVEAGAGLHAVCGVLPRKKITVPREFLAGVERIEPTFRVGPLLSIPSLGALNPILPTPRVEGHDVEWVRYEPGEDGEEGEWRENVVPQLPPVGAVPPRRARVSQGWMRLVRREDSPDSG